MSQISASVIKFEKRADDELLGAPGCNDMPTKIGEYYKMPRLRSDWLSAEGAMRGEPLSTFSETGLYCFVWILCRMCIRDPKDFDSPDVSDDEEQAGLLAENKVLPIPQASSFTNDFRIF